MNTVLLAHSPHVWEQTAVPVSTWVAGTPVASRVYIGRVLGWIAQVGLKPDPLRRDIGALVGC